MMRMMSLCSPWRILHSISVSKETLILKLLGLYLDTPKDHCSTLSILNKLTSIAKGIATFYDKYCVWGKKVKPQQQQNKKSKHKNPCQSQESSTGPLAPQLMRYVLTTETTEHIV